MRQQCSLRMFIQSPDECAPTIKTHRHAQERIALLYNYNVPVSLKSWIDHVVRKGLTLGHNGKGLVTGKRATLLIASGGSYQEGLPIRDRDIATRYLRFISSVIGITDMTFVAGDGAKAVDLREQTMANCVEKLAPELAHTAGV